MSPSARQNEHDDEITSQPHVSFTEQDAGTSQLSYKSECISAITGTKHDGNSIAESRLNDAVSLDSSDSATLSKKLQQSQ